VIVVMKPDCPPCEEAIPFYQRLLALPRMDGVHRRLVVIGRGGVVPVQRLLQAHAFKPHALTSGPAAANEISQFPMVVVVDGKGQRRNAWTGPLTKQQAQQIMSAVTGSSGKPSR
jgi:hypothetical protein